MRHLIANGLLALALIPCLGQDQQRERRSVSPVKEQSRNPTRSREIDLRARIAESKSIATFSDVAAQAGIRFQHQASRTSQKYMIEPMAAGVACLDFDSDGFLDLFFVNGMIMMGTRIYMSQILAGICFTTIRVMEHSKKRRAMRVSPPAAGVVAPPS
jgi:hypothetical protein